MTATQEQPRLKWTPHPIVDALVPPCTEEELRAWLARPGGFDQALAYWEHHEALIKEAEEDPLHKGFELAFWQDFREFLARKDELYALGGNGPGKTEIGGKLVCEKLCSDRGMKVLCVAQNENASKQLQQPAIYKYLPPSFRATNEALGPQKRTARKNLNYSQKGGFTEGTFVLPNRSQCWFKTVEQYERDNTSFEGPEYDLVWIDEPAPIALVDTLSYRVGKRRGKFLFTFTAVNGFDAVCSRVLTGARMLKTLPMNWQWKVTPKAERIGGPDPRIVVPELKAEEVQVADCPAGHMPYMMQPLNPAQGVIFLWTQWNLFLPRSLENLAVPALFEKCRGKSKGTVRTRLFGWAEKISGCQFPLFNPNVHVLPHDKIPKEATIYMAADPATARSYFLLWVKVDPLGRLFVFDESPRIEEGEWVSSDGQKGDGQRLYGGIGVKGYKRYIRHRAREHGQPPLKIKGDPRGFAAAAAAVEGKETYFELFAKDHGEPDMGAMVVEPAAVRATILLDLEKVNDLLAYDTNTPISIENEPRLYISDGCQNLIRSMINWSPDQGSDSPWKDPIDTMRYLLDEPLYYQDPNIPDCVGGGGW